ncbi:MAG: hypothetical protein GY824_07570, partial [Delftia sp.]|nr:hypothetical protein [Delftia sp.]
MVDIPIPTLSPHNSLNRVQIVDLPGLPIDHQVRGQRAVDLGNRVVARYARARAEALKLPAAFAQDNLETRLELPRFVDDCLRSPDETARAAAQAIGRRLGRNLGHILLTLQRGDAVNRAARPDWKAQDWDRWAKIQRVWLGGGLMSGRLGELMVEQAHALLLELGYQGRPQVALTLHPGDVTLLGAGRYLPPASRHTLCLDFGHTLVKRAGLDCEDGALVRLHRYASLPNQAAELDAPRGLGAVIGRWLLNFMANAVAQTWDQSLAAGLPPGPDIMLCLACYTQGGRVLGRGLYFNLNALGDDVRLPLAEAIEARIGQPVRVHIIHDGSAASA